MQASDHGYMGCQIDEKETIPGDPDSQLVYVNKVGTFGDYYWWTRIAVCGIRTTHHLFFWGAGCPLELLLYADDLESLGIGAKGRQGIPLSYLLLSVLGYPFKWGKKLEVAIAWSGLGMETDYTNYKLGMVQELKGPDWLASWLGEKSNSGKVAAEGDATGPLGRLLTGRDPFWAPLHAWSAAIQGREGLLVIPTMLHVLMTWLAEKLTSGDRLQRPVRLLRILPPLSFYTDAKAESTRAWIGGFLARDGKPGPWFSLEVDRSWAPWAFSKGDPKKVIAALELLATLVGIRLWVPEGEDRKTSRSCHQRIYG